MKNIRKFLLLGLLLSTAFSAYSIDEQSYGEMGKAIYSNKPDELQQMLDAGASPNQMQELITPLGVAIEWKRQECIDILLAHPDTDVHAMYTVITRGGSGSTKNKNALLSAVNNANFEVAHKLLDMGVEADFVAKEYNFLGDFVVDETPLTAIYYLDKKQETVAVAQRIADNTKEIDRVFTYSQYKDNGLPDISLLQRLIGQGNEDRTIFNEVTISIMARGANFNRHFEISDTGAAILKQYMSATEYAAYQAQQKYIYNSCLLAAAMVGNAELLQYMIDNGASIERYDDKGAVLFSSCINIECVKVLLDCGLDIDTRHPSGMPLLLTSVTSENYDLIDGMLELGADPFIELNGYTVNEFMRTYPSSRKKKIQKVYKSHGYEL